MSATPSQSESDSPRLSDLDSPSPTDSAPSSAVGRRGLLRGGAVLAGAAGAVALSAVATRPAYAADGAPVVQGQTNAATSTTTVQIGGATGNQTNPALSLQNADGPSLALQPLASDWDGDLAVGQIANTTIGPSIGLVDPFGFQSVSYLATEYDLLALPVTEALSPVRVVDTRYPAQRGNIISTPASSFDSAGRLLAGKAMSIRLAGIDQPTALTAAFLNVVSTGSLNPGYLTVYPPGDRPLASTLNFAKGQTIANGSFAAVGVLGDWYAVTIFTSQTTHIFVDLTGTISELAPDPNARKKVPGVRRPRAARRPLRLLGRGR